MPPIRLFGLGKRRNVSPETNLYPEANNLHFNTTAELRNALDVIHRIDDPARTGYVERRIEVRNRGLYKKMNEEDRSQPPERKNS